MNFFLVSNWSCSLAELLVLVVFGLSWLLQIPIVLFLRHRSCLLLLLLLVCLNMRLRRSGRTAMRLINMLLMTFFLPYWPFLHFFHLPHFLWTRIHLTDSTYHTVDYCFGQVIDRIHLLVRSYTPGFLFRRVIRLGEAFLENVWSYLAKVLELICLLLYFADDCAGEGNRVKSKETCVK